MHQRNPKELKSTDGPSPIECPISLTTIENPTVLPKCGHLFELANIKNQAVCSLCQTPIDSLSLTVSTDVTNMIKHIQNQDVVNSSLLAENEALKAQIAEQQKLISTLNALEAKTLGKVPLELQAARMEDTLIAQRISDAEYLQKVTYAQKIIREHFINKRIPYLIEQHVRIKTEKKHYETAHRSKQTEITASIQQLPTQLNPADSVDEKKNNTFEIFRAMKEKALEGKRDNQEFSQKIQTLRMEYAQSIFPRLSRTAGLFWRWIQTNRKIQQQTAELESLRQIAQDSIKRTTCFIHQQTTTTLRLFGGKKKRNKLLNHANEKEYKLLTQAIDQGELRVVTQLLDTKIFDFKSNRVNLNFTYLCFAIYKGHIFIMKLLIEYEEDVNGYYQFGPNQQNKKMPLLSYIISNQNIRQENKIIMLRILLDASANVNQADSNGYTPLHHAACAHQKPTIKLLSQYYPNPYLINIKKHTPSQAALDLQEQNKAPKDAKIESINRLLAQIEQQAKMISVSSQAPLIKIDLPIDAAPQIEYKKPR